MERPLVNPGSFTSRRTFMGAAAAFGASVLLPKAEAAPAPDGINVLGPKPGYTPQLGTLVSMLTWMRPAVTRPVKGITPANLDVLFDAKANSIGALLLHLAATERLYQLNTFEGITDLDKLPKSYDETWGAAMNLGDEGLRRYIIWIVAAMSAETRNSPARRITYLVFR